MSASCQQLTLEVPEELKDIVIGELSECGASGIWESGEPRPGITCLEIYFDAASDLQDVMIRVRAVFDRAGLEAPKMTVGTVAERDWLGEWKKSYTSFPIGKGFFIIPSWSDSPCPPDRQPILIDPGQAFGTGTHETTQLTLEFLEELAAETNAGGNVFDLGTGSGILMIAASLLGLKQIRGCDNDADSVTVAMANIERNVPGRGLAAFCGSIDEVDKVPASSVDLLLCNLTADVILLLFKEIVRAVRPAGVAILSGILVEQRAQIRDAFERAGWIVSGDRTRGEWIAMVIRKPA